jgi:choline dehydrogenase-like flavoprotein
MLVDETILERSDTAYDVVVVGSGAAGLSVAQALRKSNCRVLVIEAGEARPTRGGQDDYIGELAPGCTHPPPHLYRMRALGGTTRIWGGRCIPFDPIDFEARSWVAHSGWPIPFRALSTYYREALEVAEAGDFEFDPSSVTNTGPTLVPGLVGSVVRTTLERFSRPTDLWKKFGPELAKSRKVDVLSSALVTRVLVDDYGSTVVGLSVMTRSGRRRVAKGRLYVLAGGGFETTRLMLASNLEGEPGAGGGEALGRYYTTHICSTAGVLTGNPQRGRILYGYERDRAGIYVRRRLGFTQDAQRKFQLSNTTFRTHLPNPGDPSHRSAILSAMYLTKSLLPREYAAKMSEGETGLAGYAAHARNLLRQPFALGKFATMWMRRRVLASRKLPSVALPSDKERYVLEFQAEQIPDADNRVTLGSSLDRFGARRLVLDWRVRSADVDSLLRSYSALSDVLEETGAGHLAYEPEVLADRACRLGAAGGHHMGTTRMSDDDKLGVVDGDCKVHGISNLFIAGASVFPTAGQANPTLTVIALALRLADRLMDIMAERKSGPGLVSISNDGLQLSTKLSPRVISRIHPWPSLNARRT